MLHIWTSETIFSPSQHTHRINSLPVSVKNISQPSKTHFDIGGTVVKHIVKTCERTLRKNTRDMGTLHMCKAHCKTKTMRAKFEKKYTRHGITCTLHVLNTQVVVLDESVQKQKQAQHTGVLERTPILAEVCWKGTF